ncbi:MAG TPA: FliG C-terminal domain-containing protein [Hyphomicrobiaceae bacterium]|nr:FliG C-terminal domain-containing protein [Hyphomicrobiaceae bacterium]
MAATSRARTDAAASAALSGTEKVAVLLLALGKARAAKLLKKFDADELKLLTRSAADLRPVRMSDLEALVEEFAQTFSSGVGFAGTFNEVKNLLSGVMTEEQLAAALAEAPVREEEPVWDRVATLSADTLRGYLSKEHPQTVAFILSRVDSELAASVIGKFAPESRNSLLLRMVALKGVADDAAKALEGTLREDLVSSTSSASSHMGIADILNRLDKSQSAELLQSLAEVKPEEAKAIKGLLFTFEDVARLPQQARTLIFDQVPIERLVIALKGTDPDFQAAILSSLASRSRRMVEAELQGGSAPAQRELAEARRGIVATVLRMIASGDIQVEAEADAVAPGA